MTDRLSGTNAQGCTASDIDENSLLDSYIIAREPQLDRARQLLKSEQEKGKFKTLDDVEKKVALASALGITDEKDKESPLKLAAKLVEHGLMSPVIPPGHSISKKGGSNYVNPLLVGENQAKENIKNWVNENIQCAEQVTEQLPSWQALCSALNIDHRISTLRAELINRGWLLPSIAREPQDRARKLLKLEQEKGKFQTLDDVKVKYALASALGIDEKDKNRRLKLAAKLVEHGLMSPVIPPGHSIKGGSNYVNPLVVGENQAEENIKIWVKEYFEEYKAEWQETKDKIFTLDDVEIKVALASALGMDEKDKYNALKLAANLVEHGLMSPVIPPGHSIKGGSNYVNPLLVGENQAKENIKIWFEEYKAEWQANKDKTFTLDDVGDVQEKPALASALGITDENDKQSRTELAAKLVEHGLMSPVIPPGHSISKKGGSNYLDPEVVGENQAKENIKNWVNENIQCAEQVTQQLPSWKALCTALNIDHRIIALRAELINRGWLLPSIAREPQDRARKLLKLEQEKGKFQTLDDVEGKRALASALGITDEKDKESPLKIAAKLVEHGLMSPVIPPGHSIKGGSNYIKPEVVGENQAKENKKIWVKEYFEEYKAEWQANKDKTFTLDDLGDIKEKYALASALGITDENDKQSRTELAAKLVEHGLMSPVIPPGHSISKKGGSNYLDPEVVGENQAKENTKNWVNENIQCAEQVTKKLPSWQALCTALNIDRRISALRAELTNRGWLLPSDETTYGNTDLPDAFKRQHTHNADGKPRSKIANRLQEDKVGVELVKDIKRQVTFTKGEAFEQLVGLYLAYSNPDQKLWGQYCLDVNEENGFFGTRADWKIGDKIVEVKWGGAAENIEETAKKHLDLIAPTQRYEVIVLKNIPLNVPVTPFEKLVAGEALFQKVTGILEDLAQAAPSETTLNRLVHFRDALYSLNVEQNGLSPEARLQKIPALLEQICTGEEPLDSRLKSLATRRFSPLAAVFEHDGVIFRDRISIPAYQKETNYYDLQWRFGDDLYFKNQDDRDVAVYLECTEDFYNEGLTANDALGIARNTGKRFVIEKAVFDLLDGRKVSLHEGLADIHLQSPEDLRQCLPMSDDDQNFVKRYLADHGSQA